jgi:hypothetical protein
MKTPAERFKENLLLFVDLCKDLLADLIAKKRTTLNPSIIPTASIFISSLSADELMENFIENGNLFFAKIKLRDKTFFVENSQKIFPDVPLELLDQIKNIFLSGSVEDEESFWEFFDSFVKTSIHYIHEKRKPFLLDNEPRYHVQYQQKINIKKLSEQWNVILKFQ